MIRALSGLIQSVSTSSLMTFNQREFSLNMVAVSDFIFIFRCFLGDASIFPSDEHFTQQFTFNQSTFGGASSNEGQVMFDTSSFLNWWFGSKKTSGIVAANGKETSIETKLDSQRHLKTELSAVPTASVGIEHNIENSKNTLINKSSATIVSRSSIENPTFLAGYMDFDPMVAATRIHSTSAHHRGRRASWFNRSD